MNGRDESSRHLNEGIELPSFCCTAMEPAITDTDLSTTFKHGCVDTFNINTEGYAF